jgi:hypothetical protein
MVVGKGMMCWNPTTAEVKVGGILILSEIMWLAT